MLRVVDHFWGSDTGRQRHHNEDSYYASPPLFVVADGMGGAQAGEVASDMVVQAFRSGLPGTGSAEERLATVIRTANGQIHDTARTDKQRAGMGTTIAAALLGEHDLSVAHVGDSRAYLLRDSELRPLTRDHSLVQTLIDQGRLSAEEAQFHPQRSIITRALGPEPEVDVETRTYGMQAGDVVLLCSDGLTSMIDEQAMLSTLREHAGLEAAGRGLIAAANAAGGRDNITVILFRLGGEGDGAAAGEQLTEARAPVVPDEPATLAHQVPRPAGDEDGPAGPADPADRPAKPTTQFIPAVGTPASPAESPSPSGGSPSSGGSPPSGGSPSSGGSPPSTPASAAPAPASEPSGASAGARAPTPSEPPVRRQQPAPPQPAPPKGLRRRRGGGRGSRRRRLMGALIFASLLALVLGGGWLASRDVFFVGTDAHGLVTVFRGVPYDLPLGIRLYEEFYVSGVPAQTVPAARRKKLLNHSWRSRKDAESLVNQLERGKLAGQ